MSFLSIAPDVVAGASTDLQDLGSELRSATAAAASQTTAIAAPAADEVSSAVTAFFAAHAQEFQALSAKAGAFHAEFANLLNGGAAQYASTELTNAQQTVANALNAPARALLGAAANPAQSINLQLGPLSASLDVEQVTYSDGGSGLSGVGAVTLHTPFGSPTLAGASVGVGILGDGTFYGNIYESLGRAFVTVDVTGYFGAAAPIPTYLAYNFDGLLVAWPGTSKLGPIFPNISWDPNP